MSYEGYDQVLCENGHYWMYDCYDFWSAEDWKCPTCQAKFAWSNMVDVTNGSWEEGGPFDAEHRIDGHVVMEIVDECKCAYCGHIKELKYKIPTEADMRKAKPWRYSNE